MRRDPKKLWKVIGISTLIGIAVAIILGVIFHEKNVVVILTAFGITSMSLALGYGIYEASQEKKNDGDNSR